MHHGARYNCRVVFYNKQIVLIRPKLHLAIDRNYREQRWFTAWTKTRMTEEYILPSVISQINGQVNWLANQSHFYFLYFRLLRLLVML